MIILGIDPGIAIVGWGVLEYNGSKFKTLDYGSIQTPSSMTTEKRLSAIYAELREIIKKYNPEGMAIEELFWNTNQKTGICVAEARGIILLSAFRRKLKINSCILFTRVFSFNKIILVI